MLRKLILAVGMALVLALPAHAADPQKFGDEAKATAFCKAGNVVWFNPQQNLLPARLAVLRQDEARRVHLHGVGGEGRLPGD